MDKNILAFLIVIVIFAISVTVFAFIYHGYNKENEDPYERSFTHAMYTSFTIQTTIGLSDPPNSHRKSLQIWVMVQSFITYVISLGVVFILIKSLYKEEKYSEKLLQNDVKELKDLMLKLHNNYPESFKLKKK